MSDTTDTTAPPATRRPDRGRRLLKVYLEKPELAGLVLLVALVAFFQLRSDGVFLSEANLRGILGILPEVGLVAVGVTILMIAGEFDLSVGSVFALMPMSVTLLLNEGVPFAGAMLLGLGVCACVGVVNGVVTMRFAIPSFITTLGMLFVARSLTVVISGGFPPLLPLDIPSWLFTQFVGPVRLSMLWFVGIAVLLGLMLTRTNLGNWIRATGGNLEAAKSMGIPVQRVKLFCFVLCSMLAGLAGTIQVFRLGSPLPSLGEGLELQAVAAAVIGGTALAGGIGTVLGGVIGAVLLRVIDNGLVLTRVDANWFKFAVGTLLILAVVSNAWLRKTARRLKVET
ncbi:ABC transporter permease [Jannaschia sp. LMIT008]|uniref:ABC transporter permease n=1 Tax=Jannaschia maritima TaxID=3032585 RepID=UPI0028126365|nr:ABC transporter permease [Jannaschia sp. LMIT008]